MRPNGGADAVRVGQGVADGQAHVGQRELGDGGAVGELDHRVHDRLRVDDDLDAVVADAEQLVGLDDLEALVHERRGVHGDLRSHAPGRMGQGLVDRDRGQLARRSGPGTARRWRSARCGRARGSAPSAARRHWWTAQCSESTGISSAPGVARNGCTTGPAAMRLSLLASASRLPAASVARVTGQAGEADDAVDHDVGVGRPARPGRATTSANGSASATSARAAGRPPRPPWGGTRGPGRRGSAADEHDAEADDLVAVALGPDDVERLGADRAGRPSDGDPDRHAASLPAPRASAHRGHCRTEVRSVGR